MKFKKEDLSVDVSVLLIREIKYPWEEIWRQSLEHNEKERLSSDCPMEIYPIYSSQIPATYVSEDGLVPDLLIGLFGWWCLTY